MNVVVYSKNQAHYIHTSSAPKPPKTQRLIAAEVSNSNRKMGRKKEVVFDEQPPDFDPENPYKDPVAMIEMREHIVREKWIDIETSKIIRDKLRWCYRIEGVNHLQKCRHLVQQYLDSTRGIGWGKDGRHPDQHGPKVQSLE